MRRINASLASRRTDHVTHLNGNVHFNSYKAKMWILNQLRTFSSTSVVIINEM